MEFYPEMNTDWLTEFIVLPELDLNELPGTSEIVSTGSFQWEIYSDIILPNGMLADLAMAESADGIYHVTMLSKSTDYHRLYDEVFLPAVNSLSVVETRDLNFSHTEGLALFSYDPEVDLDIIAEDSLQFDEFKVLIFNYKSPKGGRVPATIFIPNGLGPFPGLIMMHASGGGREGIYGLGEGYTKSGAVVIFIEAPFQRPENRNRPEGLFTYTDKDREEQIQLIVDLRRAIDILVARPEVDSERLAYIGASYGATQGGILAGLEDRLKAFVFIVGDGGPIEHSTGFDDNWTPAQQWIENMQMVEPLNYVQYAAPAAILYQSALKDQAITVADAVRYQRAGSEPKNIMWYDTDHWLNEVAYFDQRVWLKRYIGIGPDN